MNSILVIFITRTSLQTTNYLGNMCCLNDPLHVCCVFLATGHERPHLKGYCSLEARSACHSPYTVHPTRTSC